MTCDYSNNSRLVLAIEWALFVSITLTSLGLLISGHQCYYKGSVLPYNNANCENIYISGIILTFICGVIIAFTLLFWLVDKCDERDNSRLTTRPVVVVNRRHRLSLSEV